MIVQVLISTLIAGSIYALVATGFNLLYGPTRFFNLAHGTLLAVGGYAFFWLTQAIGLHPWLAVAGAAISAGIVGWATDAFLYKRLRQKQSTPLVMMVTSIGVMTVIQSVVAILFGNQFRILGLGYSFSQFSVFGVTITMSQILIVSALIVTSTALAIILKWTRFGRQVRAIGDSPSLAQAIGIDSNRVISGVFFIASALVGLTGVLIGLETGIEPLMGFSWLIKGVIAAIIGTIGYWYGGIVGAFLLAFIEQLVIWQFSGEWKDVIAFAVLLIFLIVRPEGLFRKQAVRAR